MRAQDRKKKQYWRTEYPFIRKTWLANQKRGITGSECVHNLQRQDIYYDSSEGASSDESTSSLCCLNGSSASSALVLSVRCLLASKRFAETKTTTIKTTSYYELFCGQKPKRGGWKIEVVSLCTDWTEAHWLTQRPGDVFFRLTIMRN